MELQSEQDNKFWSQYLLDWIGNKNWTVEVDLITTFSFLRAWKWLRVVIRSRRHRLFESQVNSSLARGVKTQPCLKNPSPHKMNICIKLFVNQEKDEAKTTKITLSKKTHF